MGRRLSWHHVLAAVAVAFAGMAGCKCDGSKTEAEVSSTEQSLESYCRNMPACRRYEDAVAELERVAPPGSSCTKAETGSCGEFRYVEFSDGYYGYTHYFRASGPMVGARTWSDIAPQTDLGSVPSCTRIVERRLCITADSGG